MRVQNGSPSQETAELRCHEQPEGDNCTHDNPLSAYLNRRKDTLRKELVLRDTKAIEC